MELVYATILLALLEYIVMAALVGRARAKYGIHAPATTGHPDFERANRVHINTLENLDHLHAGRLDLRELRERALCSGARRVVRRGARALRRRLPASRGEAQRRRRDHGHRQHRSGRRRIDRSSRGRCSSVSRPFAQRARCSRALAGLVCVDRLQAQTVVEDPGASKTLAIVRLAGVPEVDGVLDEADLGQRDARRRPAPARSRRVRAAIAALRDSALLRRRRAVRRGAALGYRRRPDHGTGAAPR